MKKILILFILATFFSVIEDVKAQVTFDSSQANVRTVITGLDVPWEIQWGPDGWLWMTERYGMVSRLNPITGQKVTILNLTSSVEQQSESGLLGLELHNDFANKPYVYLVYTYGSWANIQEKMVRYEYDGSSLVNPMTMIQGIPGYSTHDGSRLHMLPDNTLLMTTGDAQDQSSPQDLSEMNGKFLRFNDDGTIPSDNPYPNSYVYSWGHRNPQGVVYANNRIYCAEHGPNNDDEFHIIVPGRNFGWPDVQGFCNTGTEIQYCADSNIVEPLSAWTPTIAPSDIIYYENDQFAELQNSILMTVLKDKKLIRLKLNASGDQVTGETHYMTGMYGRLRDIASSPDGTLYIATNGASWSNTDPFTHKIIELRNPNYNITAPVADFQASTTSPQPGNTVNFTDMTINNPTTWVWNFPGGNPSISYDMNPQNIQYDSSGCFDVSLIVQNSGGLDTIVKSCYIQVEVTGIDSERNDVREQIMIRPNPVKTSAVLQFHESSVGKEFRITDSNGKTVFNGVIQQLNTSLDTKNFSSGNYFIQVSGSGNTPVKFVIDR